MTITIHPDAAARFAQLGKELALQVARESRPLGPEPSPSFVPDVHIAHTISDDEIISIDPEGSFDEAGRQTSHAFQHKDQLVYIDGSTLTNFLSLARRLHSNDAFRSFISLDAVIKGLSKWLQAHLNGEPATELPEFLIAHLAPTIQTRQVWVPLPHLCVQSSIPVHSKGYIRSVTSSVIDSWQTTVRGDCSTPDEGFESLRHRLQGYAAGFFTVEGDLDSCIANAVELTQTAIAILRIFHLGTGNPEPVCATDVKYAASREGYMAICFTESGHLRTKEQMLPGHCPPWELGTREISQLRQNGLDSIVAVFDNDTPTDFARQYMDALLLYSRVPLWISLADRLIYIFAALESLFLKSDSEPIQQNLGDRLALFIGRNLDERKNIVRLLRLAYARRSAFVHHARSIEQLEELREFMKYAAFAMISLATIVARFARRGDFLQMLDDRKLS